MALQISLTTNTGIDLDSCYCIIKEVEINKINSRAMITVAYYANKNSRDNLKNPIKTKSHEINLNNFTTYFGTFLSDTSINTNPFKQSYLYLKTLNEFSSAVDV